MKTLFTILFTCLAGIGSANADPGAPRDVDVGVHVGLSDYGLVGLELRHNHLGLAVGAPGIIGFRVYREAPGQRWFAGASLVRFEGDTDGTYDGVEYTHAEYRGGAVSGGYRWQWDSGFNLTAGVNAFFGTVEFEEAGDFRGIVAIPTMSAGFVF